MTSNRLFLWSQLASPVIQEREAAAREIAEMHLGDANSGPMQQELTFWLRWQRTESRIIEALLVLVWVKLRSPNAPLPDFTAVVDAIALPSALAAELLAYIYGRKPAWDATTYFTPGALEGDHDDERLKIVRRSVAGYLRNPRLPIHLREEFGTALKREFAVVDARLDRPSLRTLRMAGSRDSIVPNFQPLIVETYISAFQRAIAAVARDDIANLSWYTCPVAPAWWIAPHDKPGLALDQLLSATSIDEIVAAIDDMQSTAFVPGRLHARTEIRDTRIVDLEIVAFYQRVEEDCAPEPGEICDAVSGPHLLLSALELPAGHSSQSSDGYAEHVSGWLVTPATLRFANPSAHIWHADACLRNPALPLAFGELEVHVDEERRTIISTLADQIVAETYYWLASPEAERNPDLLGATGVACMLSSEFFREMAASITSVAAFAVRRNIYERSASHEDFRLRTEETFVGATTLFLP